MPEGEDKASATMQDVLVSAVMLYVVEPCGGLKSQSCRSISLGDRGMYCSFGTSPGIYRLCFEV